jgi:hypothetical protein
LGSHGMSIDNGRRGCAGDADQELFRIQEIHVTTNAVGL